MCAVYFPAAGEQAVGAVNVKRVTMYAFDNSGGAGNEAGFELRKTYPPTKAGVLMADGATTDLAPDPQTVMDTSIENNPVYRSQAPVMWLSISGMNIEVYGFYVHYTW